MAETWPADLPQCFVLGYSEAVADGLVETQPEIGPPISRSRTSSAPRPLSGQMRMTRAQIATLRTFVDETIGRGALAFEFPDPTADGTLLVKFQKGSLPGWQQTAPGVYLVNIVLLVLP